MAKNIAGIDTLTDTFNTWVLRTNEVIETIKTETLTANSTAGVTGSSGSPRNASLFGTFTTTSLVANSFQITPGIVGNSSTFAISNTIRLLANNTAGSAGQVLTSNGSSVYWSTVTGGGGGSGITQLTSGNGIEFNTGATISSTGTIRVIAGDESITVDSRGVSVNTAFFSGGGSTATTLQGLTWGSPGAIGTGVANTGNFTSVTSLSSSGYRIAGDSAFIVSNTIIRSLGWLDVTTPNIAGAANTGGVRIRSNPTSNFAYLQVTNNLGTAEWSNFRFDSTGRALYSGTLEVLEDFTFSGTGTHGNGVEIGYKTVPQIIMPATSAQTIDPEESSGHHFYKTLTGAVALTVPNNTAAPCPIGTAITIINDSSSGNITLTQASGVTIQLGGTLTTGNRTIGPGGVATVLKVSTNKWIASGVGVL